MHVPPIQRTSASNTLLIVGRRSSLSLRSPITRIRHSNATQIRTLWWWGRHGNHWWNSYDEHVEERVRRHQKIMRYRYSKALRRRATWEREEISRTVWPWRTPDRWVGGWEQHKALSYGKPTLGKVEPDEPRKPKDESPEQIFHKDFESFKAAVDRAIELDPYGTLFGKKLQSPPSTNNSSWTSFSWFFDPKDIREEEFSKNETQKQPEKGAQPVQGNEPRRSESINEATPAMDKAQSLKNAKVSEEDYVYDPISMRRVPKQSNFSETSPNQPFLKSLFSEHGVDIPVKTYKPHRVYGFGGIKSGKSTEPATTKSDENVRFENSRKSELKNLMAATLGNNIDTTAEYGGKFQPTETETKEEPPISRNREFPEPNDDAPLFSGTTYESRSESTQLKKAPKSGWLVKEGFQDVSNASSNGESDPDVSYDIPVKKFESKLQPSLDRITSGSDASPSNEPRKLQPALDRYAGGVKSPSKETNESVIEPDPYQSILDKEKAEDIDLLRASDIRAATRIVRVSKQDQERAKAKTRDKMEEDFNSHPKQDDVIDNPNASFATGRLSKSLNTVWKHVRDYPQGIVAKTMQSMGIFNDNYKKYVRPTKSSMDLTEKIIFNDENLSNTPSIYTKPSNKPTSMDTVTPQPAAELEDDYAERANSLERATQDAKESQEAEDAKASQLANEVRAVYESEYGPIDAQHRQTSMENTTLAAKNVSMSEQEDFEEPEKLHPLQSASRKPGVSHSIVIEDHVSNFEPTLAKLIDGTKAVRRELHEAQQHVRALQSRRPPTNWNSLDPSLEGSADKSDVMKTSDASTSTEGMSSPNIQGMPESEPEMVENPSKEATFTSTYVILAYNSDAGKVEASPMNMPLVDLDKAVNPLKALSKLNHASEFLKHFSQLETANYELVTGGGDMLVFQKKQGSVKAELEHDQAPPSIPLNQASEMDSSTTMAGSEPNSSSTAENLEKQAAVVLDQIPPEAEPFPGPAAPIPPPSSPMANSIGQPRVKRQEKVFSGTIRPNSESFASSQRNDQSTSNQTSASSREGLWTRFTRGIRRVVLTVVGLGGAAYAIGFIAEGMGAQSQQRKGIDSGEAQGPRKRIVLTGQRPGIYSTESSR